MPGCKVGDLCYIKVVPTSPDAEHNNKYVTVTSRYTGELMAKYPDVKLAWAVDVTLKRSATGVTLEAWPDSCLIPVPPINDDETDHVAVEMSKKDTLRKAGDKMIKDMQKLPNKLPEKAT